MSSLGDCDTHIEVDPLWIEQVSTQVGLTEAGNQLRLSGVAEWATGEDDAGPLLFILLVSIFFLPVLSLIGYTQTGTFSFAANPGEPFQLTAWLVAVALLLKTKNKYEETINKLPKSTDDDVSEILNLDSKTSNILIFFGVPKSPNSKSEANLETIAPTKLKLLLLIAGVLFHLYGILFASIMEPVAELSGEPVAIVKFYIIIPFILYPIAVEMLSTFIGALVLLPFKIRRANLIDFSDPHGFANLDATGHLFKSATVYYFILLTLYVVFLTVGVGSSLTQLFNSGLLITGSCFGLGLFLLPIYWMKHYIATAKTAKIEAIAEKAREVGDSEDLFPYADPNSPDEVQEYTYNFIQRNQVRNTSEYPLNLALVEQVLFALLLPYLTTVFFEFIFNSVL